MDDAPIAFLRDRLSVSTDRRRLNLDAVLEMLRATHWGADLTRATLERAVANSLCFGLYDGVTQLGFAQFTSFSESCLPNMILPSLNSSASVVPGAAIL